MKNPKNIKMKRTKAAKKISGAQRTEWPVIQGIEACAARIGAPLALLKSLKKSGCKAFLTGNRVDTGLLVPALFAALAKGSELPEGIATPQDWLATEKAKREAIKRKQDEKLLMPISDAKRQNGEAWGFSIGYWEQHLGEEAPPEHAGRNAVELGVRYKKLVEDFRTEGKRKFEEAA